MYALIEASITSTDTPRPVTSSSPPSTRILTIASALCVLTVGQCAQRVILELDILADDLVDGLEGCVDRAVGGSGALKGLVTLSDTDDCGRGDGVAGVDDEAVEDVALLAGNRNGADQALEVAILNDLFLVSQKS